MNDKNNKLENIITNLLFSLNGKMTKKDFNRIKKFFNWKFNYKKIHVVGTNGKGSNANYLNNELIKNNYKVGLFTSPHLITIYERIKINNNEITFEQLLKYTSDFQTIFSDINFGFFDLLFLSALRLFEMNNVDVAIFEAGIGAKKDVVNYLEHNITIISSISLDHQAILGHSLEKIALDKAYSIKKNNNIYISKSIDSNLIEILKKRAIEKNNNNLNVVNVDRTNYETTNQSLTKEVLKKEFKIEHFKSLFSLPKGRMEKILINKIPCYIDVSHNVEAMNESIKYIKNKNIEIDEVVLSLSNDKNEKEIVQVLQNYFMNIYVYENKGKKPLKLFKYNESLPRIYSLSSFLKKINKKTLFIGSFYFIEEIINEVK